MTEWVESEGVVFGCLEDARIPTRGCFSGCLVMVMRLRFLVRAGRPYH